jgi:hypothetical protein
MKSTINQALKEAGSLVRLQRHRLFGALLSFRFNHATHASIISLATGIPRGFRCWTPIDYE